MKKKRLLFITVCLLGICVWYFGGKETDMPEIEPEYILTYAENHPANYPTSKGALKFAELVEERTNGKIRIQVRTNAEFGTQQQMVSQMKFGGIDFARVSLSSVSNELPKLNVLQLPFLYEDSEHMWKVLESRIGTECFESFYELDLVPLSWYDAGARSFYSKDEPIYTLEDIEGMVIRVQESELMRDMISYLGGTPVDVAYTEVYSAFETGEIDAAENSWASYYASSHYKVAKYYTVDEHTRVPEIQLMSGETWRALTEEYRTIIQECAAESARYERELWAKEEALYRRQAINAGCVEIRLSETELERFRNCVSPLYEEYCSEYMELVEEIRKIGQKGEE